MENGGANGNGPPMRGGFRGRGGKIIFSNCNFIFFVFCFMFSR